MNTTTKTRNLNSPTAQFHRLYCDECGELLTYASTVWIEFLDVFKAKGWRYQPTGEPDDPEEFLCPHGHRVMGESYDLNPRPISRKYVMTRHRRRA
jgi:hypothetical protein